MDSLVAGGPRLALAAHALAHLIAYAVCGLAIGQEPTADRSKLQPLQVDPSDSLFPGCASLKTDAEIERLLKRAQESAEAGRTDLALALWQKILDDAGGTLVAEELVQSLGPSSGPLVIYRPIRERINRQLRKLRAADMAAYRAAADAEARALLVQAESTHDEAALTKVVRRFFLSSSGGQAALKLAGIALDRHNFLAAYQILLRLLDHPDVESLKSEILLRLAVAAAHLHDNSRAKQALDQLPGAFVAENKQLVALVAAEVGSVLSQRRVADSATSNSWPMVFGNAERIGTMAAISRDGLADALTEAWIHDIEMPLAESGATPPLYRHGEANDAATSAAANEALRGELGRQWRLGNWRPTGRMLFDHGRVFSKSADQLECFDVKAEEKGPLWQSAWNNVYELDPLSRQLTRIVGVPAQPIVKSHAWPTSRPSIWMFGDRVHQSMAILNGVAYSIEGRRATALVQPQNVRNVFPDLAPRRSRSNWLTAYQTSGGKAIWTRPASDRQQAAQAEVGFLAAPISIGRLLYAPVTDGGTIWLLALDKATGETVRKTFLCDEPRGGSSPWAEIVIAADGSELYLTCGCGVAFAVSAVDGEVRWAARYQRATAKPEHNRTAIAHADDPDSVNVVSQGWDDDVVIIDGTTLLVMASDSDRLLALDRRTGRRLWESPRVSPLGSAASYCLGVQGDGLYVAGHRVLRKYEITSGRLVSEREIKNSFGRGCLTDKAVLIPAENAILEFDLGLVPARQMDVALTRDEPVGNLFSDGDKLWVVGGGRIYTLASVRSRLEVLKSRIAAGNIAARFDRARLYRIQNQFEKLSDEFRAAYVALAAEQLPSEAAQKVLTELGALRLASDEPLVVLRIVAELQLPLSPGGLSEEATQQKRELIASALASLRQRPQSGSAAALLDCVQLFDEEYLITAAAQAMERMVAASDATLLLAAIENGSAASRLISIGAAARIAPQEVGPPLSRLLREDDDRVRLAAARALASLGEQRGVLQTLVELLQSPLKPVRARAHQTLQSLTGQAIAFPTEGSVHDRATSVRSWREWVDKFGATTKLNLPLQERHSPLGRLLVTSPNVLVELDAEHKERWRLALPGAAWGCEGLPNGHRLVAINSHSMVVEYDGNGKEVWRKDRLPAPPTTVQRVPGGGTLIACGNAHQVVEVAPDGSTTTIGLPGSPASAQRLENGNTLVALPDVQRVAEVNSNGRPMWEIETTGSPAHAWRLENGNTLVTLPQARKVVEFDVTGKNIVWMSAVPLINPSTAQRLTNGNTLIADHTGILEIDSSGNQVVWRHRQPQAISVSSF